MAADWTTDRVEGIVLRKLGLPADGKWFYHQKTAVSFQQSSEGSDYKHNYAWDNPSAKRPGSKIQGLFKTAGDFLKTLDDVRPEKRHAYEWFRDGTFLKMYGDVEWKVPVENLERIHEEFASAREEGRKIMEAWKQQHRKEFERISGGFSLAYIIGEGSRITEDNSIKLSYHVIIPNVCFYNDAPRRKLVYQLMCLAPGILPNRAMDPSPYAQNQKYRTLLSSKGSDQSHTPLIFCRILSDNPDHFSDLDALVGHVPESTRKIDDLLDNPELQNLWAECVSRDDVRRGEVTSCVRSRNPSARLGSHNRSLREMAKKILCLIGDGDNEVGEPVVTSTGGYSMQCYNPLPAGRPCPWNPCNIHHSNNSTIFVDENADNSYSVKLTCHSGKCHSQHGKKRTGVIANLRMDEDQKFHLSYLDSSLFECVLKPKVHSILEKCTGDIRSSQIRKTLENDLELENGLLREDEGKISSWIRDWAVCANSKMVVAQSSAGGNTRDSPRELTQEEKERIERNREAALALRAQQEMKSAQGQIQLAQEEKDRIERNRAAALARRAQVKSSPGRMDLDQMEDNGDVDTSNQSKKRGLNEISGFVDVDEEYNEVVVTLPEVDILRSKLHSILRTADLQSMTKRTALRELEKSFSLTEGDLDDHKKEIADWVQEYIDEHSIVVEESLTDQAAAANEFENPPKKKQKNQTSEKDTDEFRNTDYLRLKAEIEKTTFKVEHPFAYCVLSDRQSTCPQQFDQSKLRQYYAEKEYKVVNQRGETKMKKAIDVWLRDPNKRQYEKIVSDPAVHDPKIYNMWPGIKAAKLPPVAEESVPDLIQPILKHVEQVLCNGDSAHAAFVLDILAQILQHPEKKTEVALVFYGEQGCGKDIVFDFFRLRVLGSGVSYQTAKAGAEMFSRFATEELLNSVFVLMDEIEDLTNKKTENLFKNQIIAQTIPWEGKHQKPIQVKNKLNFCVTTNYPNHIHIPGDDRRMCLFRCSSARVGDIVYIEKIVAVLADPRVARAFYQHLMGRNLSKYKSGFQLHRPITDYYREVQTACMPVIKRFVSGMMNDAMSVLRGNEVNKFRTPDTTAMFQRCLQFVAVNRYQATYTASSFTRELKRIHGFTKQENELLSNGKKYFVVNCSHVVDALKEKNEYDKDASLNDL